MSPFFEPPELLIVQHDLQRTPISFKWRDQVHTVTLVSNHWRDDGHLGQTRFKRDYFKVTTDTRLLVHIYYDHFDKKWYIEESFQ